MTHKPGLFLLNAIDSFFPPCQVDSSPVATFVNIYFIHGFMQMTHIFIIAGNHISEMPSADGKNHGE